MSTRRSDARRGSGFAEFFVTVALLLLGFGGTGTAAFLLLMRTGGTLWGLIAGVGWTAAAVCLLVLALGAYVAVKSSITLRRLKKKQDIYR